MKTDIHKYCLVIVIILMASRVLAQPNLDSVQQVIDTTTSLSKRIQGHITLGMHIKYIDVPKAI